MRVCILAASIDKHGMDVKNAKNQSIDLSKRSDWGVWLKSLQASNTMADIVMVGNTLPELKGVITWNTQTFPTRNPVLDRWLLTSEFLDAHPEYTHCIVTDVRDVLFQRDPVQTFLQQLGSADILWTTEGVDTDVEPWHRQLFEQREGHNPGGLAANVGVWGGKAGAVSSMSRSVFDDGVAASVQYWGIDQIKFNLRLRNMQQEQIRMANLEFAVNCGLLRHTHNKMEKPEWTREGNFRTRNATVAIVHQYDRVGVRPS